MPASGDRRCRWFGFAVGQRPCSSPPGHHRGGPRRAPRQHDGCLAADPLRPCPAYTNCAAAWRREQSARTHPSLTDGYRVASLTEAITPQTAAHAGNRLDRLGAGFAISARDLDMRGAGDLLGDAQAGHMKLIGIDLYQHLPRGRRADARSAREKLGRWSPVINIGVNRPHHPPSGFLTDTPPVTLPAHGAPDVPR